MKELNNRHKMKNFFKVMSAMIAAGSLMACGGGGEAQSCCSSSNCDCAKGDKKACVDPAACACGQAEYVNEAVIENIMSRRSIRRYANKQVPAELLDTILVCGINAPNARNQQSYEIKVVTDSACVAFLADNLNGLYKAPVYVFIANDVNAGMSLIDVGLLSENIGLAAWAYGIGSINLGMPVRAMKEKPELLAKLQFSEGYDLCLVLALGYPDETPDAKPRVKEKIQYVNLLSDED